MIKIEQLQYLLELEKTGSFHKCAESLFRSQPAISTSIKNLESELGVALFVRTPTGIYLTPIGKEIMPIAENILQQMQEIYLTCSRYLYLKQEEPVERLHIYCHDSLISNLLPKTITILHRYMPDTKFILGEGSFQENWKQFLETADSLGLFYMWEKDEFQEQYQEMGIRAEVLCDVELFLVAAEDFPIKFKSKLTWEDLSEYHDLPMIGYRHASPLTREMAERLIKQKVAKIIFEAPNSKMYGSYIEQGIGFGIVARLNQKRMITSMQRENIHFVPLIMEKKAKLVLFSHANLSEQVRNIFTTLLYDALNNETV